MEFQYEQIDQLKFDANGLIPAVVQDDQSNDILMMGYMNKTSLELTLETKRVTFFSRSRKKLWTKGETSGNFLILRQIFVDCDQDTLLVRAKPEGNSCHLNTYSCFFDAKSENLGFLLKLEKLIQKRKTELPENSYTTRLFKSGINKIAQKVGEEAVELVIEAKDENRNLFIGEAADLFFHYLVLLQAKNVSLSDVQNELVKRHKI